MRRCAESVEVRTLQDGWEPGGQPDAFVWRGRLYVVCEVLDRWRRRHPWWRHVTEAEGLALEAGTDQEVWRVEARAGRHRPAGVFDLVAPPVGVAAGWRLDRVLD
ncbi:DUF6504 family protein [Kytococcus sp. Marseille-QA3725]